MSMGTVKPPSGLLDGGLFAIGKLVQNRCAVVMEGKLGSPTASPR